MNPPKPHSPLIASAVAATSAPPYTDPGDGEEQAVTRAPGDQPRLPREAARPDGYLSGEPGRERARDSLTRGQKILVAMLAALLGSGAAGYFSLNATMNANFTAVNGHLLSLQEQIGRLDARIARLEALFEAGLTPVAPRSSPPGKPGPPPDP